MKLLIIAGFLGSGKTTVLLQGAKHLVSYSQDVTIIENEIGEIGIDGRYLDLNGLKVQELFGGCVCCTLSTGLIETIDKICNIRNPDWIILEATGIARPMDITGNLHRLTAEVDSVQVITILDAGRYEMLIEVMEPLITSGIESANAIIVNKIDQVDAGKVDQIANEVKRLNSDAPVFRTSDRENDNLDGFLDYLWQKEL